MRNKIKNNLIKIILGIYILTNFFQSTFYVGNNVYAANTSNTESQKDYTNIVAILVNDKIYDSIKSEIQRYSTKYIQGDGSNKNTSISNSKALVFPINVDNFSAKNIVQLLENIYFGGIEGETSKLIGLVLVGDFPLPVVNQDGYIYPTIYPYVDFQEQKFIRDEESKYFVYNDNPNGQAEIWHGMINFGENINEYKDYFDKLHEYRTNPNKYIGKAIRYEDFIGNNKYFNDNTLNFYLNNFIFAEDIGYHRYSDLMVKVLQGQRNNEIGELMEQLNEVSSAGGDLAEGMEVLAQLNDNMNTPTMQIKSMLDNGYLSTYSSLFGQKYLKKILNNIETANRWIESRTGLQGNQLYVNAFDSVYKKAEISDEVLLRKDGGIEPFLIMINNALEEAVDQKVEEERYRLNEVIPMTYLKYKGRKRFLGKCVWDIYDAYENYFFGTNAKYVQNMEETSTYRGTFRNYIGIDSLKIQDIQSSQNPATDVSNLDLNKKSIGGSYEIFATQVDANRGYNYNNSLEEYEIYSGNKTAKMENWDVNCVKKFLGICIKRRWAISRTNGSGCDLSSGGDQGGCEDPIEYANRNWGGASPLNLDMSGTNFLRKSGYFYTGAISTIFDIAGSMALSSNTPEYESNSFESVNKYSNLTLRRFSPDTDNWPKYKSGNPTKKKPDSYGFGYDYSMDYEVKFTNWIPQFDGRSIVGWEIKPSLTADSVDYFNKYNNSSTQEKQGNIIKIQKFLQGGDESCQGAGEIYTYKTLDSRVKNDSVNADEVNGYSYKVFQDDVSHTRQFYLELSDYIEAISGSVNNVVGNETGSLKFLLEEIRVNIDDINNGFQNIKDFDIQNVRNFTTGELIVRAGMWQSVFDVQTATGLLEKIKNAQDGVLELKGFVEIGDTLFDGVVDFIQEQKNLFDVNGRDLIFLDNWKTQLFLSIKDILENYSKIKTVILECRIAYDRINEIGKKDPAGISIPDIGIGFIDDLLSMKIVEDLTEKREFLQGEENGSGCETKYMRLCESLDNLINNYNRYVYTINEEKNGINNLKEQRFDDEGEPIVGSYETIENVFTSMIGAAVFSSINNTLGAFGNPTSLLQMTNNENDTLIYLHNIIYSIPSTGNQELTAFKPGMNMTTSDRPIDSPRYLTFKGIAGNKVTFIYPDIYKSEIFSGDSNILTLKSTGDIKKAIIKYLTGVVQKYNEYLGNELSNSRNYYRQNTEAFNLLDSLDELANPNHLRDNVRPYALFDDDYLVNRLENTIRISPYFSGEDFAQSDPIGFIASMIYFQNVAWQTKTISGTIQGDFDNQRMDFDINEKISYLMDNYLISDNDKGKYLTPDYRASGYEVAFINSNGNDRILYENTPAIVETINTPSNYVAPIHINTELIPLEEQLMSECNIPMDQGVLIFQLSSGRIDTPWFDALECRWKITMEKPIELKIKFPFAIDTGLNFWNNLLGIMNLDQYTGMLDPYRTYANQIQLLGTTNEINENILADLEMTNPSMATDLQEVLSYTLINPIKSTISADNPKGEITITSIKQLGEVEFRVVNVGNSKIKLSVGDTNVSNNITVGIGGFSTGVFKLDPYDQNNSDLKKTIQFQIDNPQEGLNVVIFDLCVPQIQNCVKHSFRLDVVPGEVKNIEIELEKNKVLEGASVPFKLKGTDAFGNKIGELISQKFETLTTSGILSLNGVQGQSIKISNFNKTNFSLIATGGNLDGKTINIQVSGSIDEVPGIKATESITVIKGRLDTYSGNTKLTSGSSIITGLQIQLPEKDIYFTNNQPNTGTLPHITFRLVDKNGNLINIDGRVSVKTKSNHLTPGIITTKSNGENKFTKSQYFDLSGGICTIYLSPNFSAGEDLLYVSMAGVDDIQLPIVIRHALPRVLGLSAEKTQLKPDSSTDANLKLFDSRGNVIDDDDSIFVVLGSADDKISLSKSGNIRIQSGSLDFKIYSHDKGGLGHIYAYIHTGIVQMDKQSPDTLTITIQQKMLPEEDLNVMYLNLFGNDRGNQWGYMSDNQKYSESLIKNSDKLLAITTQLLNLENIKYYPIVINKKLQINNLIGNNVVFRLSSGFVFDIDQIGTISVSPNGFSFLEARISEDALEQYINTMMLGTYKNKNVLFYVPEQTDSIVESNEVLDKAIYINGQKVFDIRNKVYSDRLITILSDEKTAGYQVRNMVFDDILVGKLIFAVDNEQTVSINLTSKYSEYGVGEVWINGSSHEYGLGFYEIDSSLPTRTFGYKSIQDSYDPMAGIGFTADFKNITNFGGGMPVGEATLPFGSELLINIGDPLLKRIDGNDSAKIYDESGTLIQDTEFDLGLGEVIYSDPDKEILKVINIDFNNDKLEDIIVIYKDGSVNILKNYGGTNPFQNLGPLMTLAERISDVSAGDVDGNGYEDLLVWTTAGGVRVYLNHKGIFDVDGYPVCINVNVDDGEVSEHPEKIAGIHQIFLRDMDLDGAVDIVTNDKLGFVKIFYGGTSNGNVNYISTNKYMCDDDWYTRVQNNSKIVYQFGIKIDSNSHVLDQSLIRWKGISSTGSQEHNDTVGIDISMFENRELSLDDIPDLLNNITNFDTTQAESLYLQSERLKKAGFGVIPVYESGIDNEGDIDYVEIGALTGTDPVKIYKIYEDMNHNPIDSNLVDNTGSLVDGDLVRVTVYIKANEDFTGTFIDRISGPWIIPISQYDESTFENFWFDSDYVNRGYITSGQIENIIPHIHWDLGNSRYMLDNISMKRGNVLKFSYGLIYSQYDSFDIDVDVMTGNTFSGVVYPTESLNNFSHDKYPDILIQPMDGCNKSMFVFFNNGSGSRDYTQKFMDLQKLVEEYNANAGGATNDLMQGLGDSAANGDVQQVYDTVSEFTHGVLGETLDWKWFKQTLSQTVSQEGIGFTDIFNSGTLLIDGLTSNAANKIDETIGQACNGFSVDLGGGGGCGLPVPFNQAFLGVGNYHAFGCYNIDILSNTIGKGIPVLNIPTTYGTYPGPGAFGLPTKVEGTDTYFLGAPTGTFPSLFRLYIMPTLTAKIGVALCFFPQTIGDNIPEPIASIAGNCVVFAIDPCSKKSEDEDEGPNSVQNIPDEYTYLRGCERQNNPLYLMPGESASPFLFGGSSPSAQSFQPIIPGGSYAGGFINIEVSPEAIYQYQDHQESSPLDIDAITLEGGATTQNAIRGSKEQGLIQTIVKNWLDRQIKYIMNNLTNFKISIIRPDFESLLGKEPPTSLQEMGQEYCEEIKGMWIEGDAAKGICYGKDACCKDTEESKKIKCEDRGRQRDSQNKKCVNKISQNFEDEALASIDSRTQKNMLSRQQISSRSDYNNPFKELEKAFSNTPLINISTQDITVNVPLLTSEDITAYISMSQSWINRQIEVLEDWQVFFESVIGVCGGRTNINGINDLGNAVNELKEQYKDANANSQQTSGDDQMLENLQGKINALEKLKTNYNLSDFGDYKIYEAKDGGFYVYVKYSDVNTIIPKDVYLYFDPNSNNLSMFTSGFDLLINTVSNNNVGKKKLSIERNNQEISNSGLAINKASQNINYSCAEVFLDGTIDGALNGFLNVQSSADSLIFSVKQNIETLQQYKLFPLQLYDRMHVIERYLGDISTLINSTLGTFSIWMETNANRYSQYIDAIITIMTTLETYQLIIDLSADRTESCSTCTNDNYDQFSCKLGGICDMLQIELPVLEIPPTKIPSIYLDFSNIHIQTDIVLPNFIFNPVAVPLPELPNIPSPPKLDLSVNLDDLAKMGIDLVGQLKGQDFSRFSSFNVGSIPILPSPPNLPDLLSFIPEIEMELPLLPPAPKIPELPNTITGAIKAAKIIGKILCIVKGKFGLVAENSIKAKVEQITQRDYEIPFWDNFDLTSSERNLNTAAKMSPTLARIFTGFTTFLNTDQFKDVQLKGFDISLNTYVNLQYNFDDFYAFVQSVVKQINTLSYKFTDYAQIATDSVSGRSKQATQKMQACVNNPISVECNPEAAEEIEKLNELKQKLERYKNLLNTSFDGIGAVLDQIESKTNEIQTLTEEVENLTQQLQENNNKLNEYQTQLANTYEPVDKSIILSDIEYIQGVINTIQKEIDDRNDKIATLQQEIDALNTEYGVVLQKYAEIKQLYESLSAEIGVITQNLLDQGQEIIDKVNQEIQEAGQNIDFQQLYESSEKIKADQEELDAGKNRDKNRRYENLQDLYKETQGTISYVDYDKTINQNNINILKQTLTEINRQTNNKDIKNRSKEYLSLITMNKKIDANVDSVNNIQKKYESIIDNYQSNNDEILDLIENDYDKFLVAVSDNNTSLVSNDSINITLSTNLFDMDKNTIKVLSNQDSFVKKYVDYNMNNIQGYLTALENHDAESLNMTQEEYNMSKSYLKEIKDLSDSVFLAQSAGGGNGGGGNSSSSISNSVDIANYIQGQFITTKEGNFVLANQDYLKTFQSKYILTDINGDNRSDLILWDNHNIYIKYRKDNSNYDNTKYDNSSRYYSYHITSYEDLVNDAEDGIVKIRNSLFNSINVKLVSPNREVKNFKYAGQTFDTIKVSWSANSVVGDDIDGYLVKMIHRVDQFNDHESLISHGNNRELFDKKYVLVLPKGSQVTGTKLQTQEGILPNTERWIGTGNKVFSLLYFNNGDKTINLTVTDLPRNWQYSEIYTLNFEDNTYKISSVSSNQIVAGPQIIADTQGPDADIRLYRPATDSVVSEGLSLQGYVGTNYILQVDWEDNVAMDEMWIFDEYGETLAVTQNVNSQTGHIELSGLYFTGTQSLAYYVVGVDIDGNRYSTDVNLNIKTPTIEIINILQGNQNLTYSNGFVGFSPSSNFGGLPTAGNDESVVTVVAELEHDIDSGYVQFFGNRTKDKRVLLTGNIGNNSIPSFKVQAGTDKVYGGNFSIGDDIGLYSASGDMVAKINPKNGKITVTPGYNVIIKLDYSAKIPIIKVIQGDKIIFWIVYIGEELVDLSVNSSNLTIQTLDNELLGDFYGGKAVIRNGEVLLYVSPKGQIYTETALYGEYSFDDSTQSVVYSFRTTPNGSNLGSVKIKIKNILEY